MLEPKESCGIIVDLDGQQGNAYVILGLAERLGKVIGKSESEIAKIRDDMTSADYFHLVAVFEVNFGSIVRLQASEELLEAVRLVVEKIETKEKLNALDRK